MTYFHIDKVDTSIGAERFHFRVRKRDWAGGSHSLWPPGKPVATGAGLVERDFENAWLATDTEASVLDDLIGHAITYRIAVGRRAWQKLFTLQTVPPRLQGLEGEPNGAARAGGFSLHAGVDIAANQRDWRRWCLSRRCT